MGNEVTFVRVYLSEAERGPRKNLMREILNILQDQQRVKAVTVFRGIAGLGAAGEVQAGDILRLMVDLPLVIEFFDEPKVVDAVLDLLKDLVAHDRIVTWRATCR